MCIQKFAVIIKGKDTTLDKYNVNVALTADYSIS